MREETGPSNSVCPVGVPAHNAVVQSSPDRLFQIAGAQTWFGHFTTSRWAALGDATCTMMRINVAGRKRTTSTDLIFLVVMRFKRRCLCIDIVLVVIGVRAPGIKPAKQEQTGKISP